MAFANEKDFFCNQIQRRQTAGSFSFFFLNVRYNSRKYTVKNDYLRWRLLVMFWTLKGKKHAYSKYSNMSFLPFHIHVKSIQIKF